LWGHKQYITIVALTCVTLPLWSCSSLRNQRVLFGMTLIKQLKSFASSLATDVVHTSKSFLWKPTHAPILLCWTLLTIEWMLKFSVSKILFVVVFYDCECINVQELQNLTLEILRASIKTFVWVCNKLSCQGTVDIHNQFVLDRMENLRLRGIRCSNTWMGCVKKSSPFFCLPSFMRKVLLLNK
jgi:hypothetical protein